MKKSGSALRRPMLRFLLSAGVAIGSLLSAGPTAEVQASAQSATLQMVTDGVVSGGESCNDGHMRVARSVIGEPIANDVASPLYQLSEGHFVTQQQALLLLPHQAPTINPVSTPTAASTQLLTGTKTPDTSLWLGGVQVVALNAQTTWSHTATLAEGTNVLNVLTKDNLGNSSAAITVGILLDTTPPAAPLVTDDGAYTTRFTQLHAVWSAADAQSGISGYEYRLGTTPSGSEIAPAASAGLLTEITRTGLALAQGRLYYVAVRAKNGAGSWSGWGASDGIYANGSAPIISSFSPSDASTLLSGESVKFNATAQDGDNDPLEYRFSSNGNVRRNWGASNLFEWITSASDIGLHAIKAEVRDGLGGSAQKDQEIYILRPPVEAP